MLTRMDLAVLRAALKFFDEEMTPHGRETAQPYFDQRLPTGFDLRGVSDLRRRLRSCRQRYLICDANAKRALSADLLARPSRASALGQALGGKIGTVLLFAGPP
jgi:hypothetical protein